mgnify:CR=1 FL=1
MKLLADWSIDNVGYKAFDDAEVLDIAQIISLSKKLNVNDTDTLYLKHLTKPLDQIAINGSKDEDVEIQVHGHGGAHVLHTSFSELERLLNEFEDVTENPTSYGFYYA